MMKTITRADVAEILYQEVGLSRKDSGEILDITCCVYGISRPLRVT